MNCRLFDESLSSKINKKRVQQFNSFPKGWSHLNCRNSWRSASPNLLFYTCCLIMQIECTYLLRCLHFYGIDTCAWDIALISMRLTLALTVPLFHSKEIKDIIAWCNSSSNLGDPWSREKARPLKWHNFVLQKINLVLAKKDIKVWKNVKLADCLPMRLSWKHLLFLDATRLLRTFRSARKSKNSKGELGTRTLTKFDKWIISFDPK